MSFIGDLLASPPVQSTLSKYTVLNGVIYLATGVLLIFWPGATQTLFFIRLLWVTRKGSCAPSA